MHLKPRYLLAVCVTFLQFAFTDSSVNKELKCNMTLPEDMIVWEDTDQTTVNVSVRGEKVWCDVNGLCLDDAQLDNSTTHVKQFKPVIIPEGTHLRFTIPTGLPVDYMNVFKTDRDGFTSCDAENVTAAFRNVSADDQPIAADKLAKGIAYFIFVGENDTVFNCTDGDRIAVVIKANDCIKHALPICSDRGTCVTKSVTSHDTFSCKCCEEYTGSVCENQNNIDASNCLHTNCQNGGTCNDYIPRGEPNSTDAINSTRCDCGPYFTGQYCETRIDSCRSNPCQHGVCVEKPPSYQCYCLPGFHGSQCEEEYDECISNPCLNGATCVDRLDRYTCVCTRGHTGVNCEKKVNLCQPNPCHFNSTCVDHENTFSCTCPKGLTGHTCESQINECASNPCQNQGTCVDLKNGFECICPITFAGIHCEYMMDVFAPPIEGSDINGSHSHNLYVVAGTLSGAIMLVLIVLVACYCKMHETYRQLAWRRMRYKKRSLSCPDLESYGGASTTNKHRLSVDAIWEATSLCYDNASYDNSQQQSLASQRI